MLSPDLSATSSATTNSLPQWMRWLRHKLGLYFGSESVREEVVIEYVPIESRLTAIPVPVLPPVNFSMDFSIDVRRDFASILETNNAELLERRAQMHQEEPLLSRLRLLDQLSAVPTTHVSTCDFNPHHADNRSVANAEATASAAAARYVGKMQQNAEKWRSGITTQAALDIIPDDPWGLVFNALDPESLAALAGSCKKFYCQVSATHDEGRQKRLANYFLGKTYLHLLPKGCLPPTDDDPRTGYVLRRHN